METWWVELTVGEKKLSWGKDPERFIPGKCTIRIDVYDGDDATQPHTQEMHWQI